MEGQMDLFADYAARRPASESEPVEVWRRARARQVEELARKIGVPLHQEVEVWLTQGLRLRGLLRLAKDGLRAEGERDRIVMRIGKATFRLGEMESIVRLDEPS